MTPIALGSNHPTRAPTARWMQRPWARLAWCLLGAAAGIGLALWCVGPPHHGFVLASLGGSTVFLFGLTRAPAAQLRALLGLACLLGVALVWSRLYPGLAHYPVRPFEPSPPRLDWGGWADDRKPG